MPSRRPRRAPCGPGTRYRNPATGASPLAFAASKIRWSFSRLARMLEKADVGGRALEGDLSARSNQHTVPESSFLHALPGLLRRRVALPADVGQPRACVR